VGLVDDYFAALKKKKTVLAISPTHYQGDLVNAAIRQRLKKESRIGGRDRVALRLVNCQLTEAEKQDARNYQTGQAIRFNRKCGGFGRGNLWSVCANSGNGVILQDQSGNKGTLPLDQVNGFEVYHKAEIGLAKGDSIRVTRNGHDIGEKRLNNGQAMEVVGFDRKGNIRARNPISKAQYVLPADYGHIAHTYCVTSHGSQGKTVDEIFIAQPSVTFPATNLKQFYVSVSRARDAVHIYTDDPANLLERASDAGDRVSAIELLNGERATQEAIERHIREQAPEAKPELKNTAPSKQSQPFMRVHVRPAI
jgi:hypothetical protein